MATADVDDYPPLHSRINFCTYKDHTNAGVTIPNKKLGLKMKVCRRYGVDSHPALNVAAVTLSSHHDSTAMRASGSDQLKPTSQTTNTRDPPPATQHRPRSTLAPVEVYNHGQRHKNKPTNNRQPTVDDRRPTQQKIEGYATYQAATGNRPPTCNLLATVNHFHVRSCGAAVSQLTELPNCQTNGRSVGGWRLECWSVGNELN